MSLTFMSPTIGEISLALSKARRAIESASKDTQGHNYKYTELSTWLEIIKIPLADNDLAITQLLSIEDGEQVLLTLLVHKSGEWFKSTFIIRSQGNKMLNEMQALGSGITYARRYSITAILNLGQEDDDGSTSNHTNKPTNKPIYKPKFNPDSPVPSREQIEQQELRLSFEALKKLCLEHHIELVDFAKFHNIESKKIETVKNAVDNFSSLLFQFNNRELPILLEEVEG